MAKRERHVYGGMGVAILVEKDIWFLTLLDKISYSNKARKGSVHLFILVFLSLV